MEHSRESELSESDLLDFSAGRVERQLQELVRELDGLKKAKVDM